MKKPLNEEFKRMQKLAGIITENELKVGDTIKMPFIGSSGNQDDGKILAISTYQDNKKAIDKAIRDGGWEQQTDSSKEESSNGNRISLIILFIITSQLLFFIL